LQRVVVAGSHRCRGILDVAGRSTLIVDCSLTHSLLDAKLSTVRLQHVVGPTWRSTSALPLQGVIVAGAHHCRESSLQGFVVAECCRCRRLSLQGVKADCCSMMYSLLDAKLSTVRLHHRIDRTWQSTLALTLADGRHCRGSSLQGVDDAERAVLSMQIVVATGVQC
jgi:hypothetical protein